MQIFVLVDDIVEPDLKLVSLLFVIGCLQTLEIEGFDCLFEFLAFGFLRFHLVGELLLYFFDLALEDLILLVAEPISGFAIAVE